MITRQESEENHEWSIHSRINIFQVAATIDINISPNKLREIADHMEEDRKKDKYTDVGSFYGTTLSQEAKDPVRIRILWTPVKTGILRSKENSNE